MLSFMAERPQFIYLPVEAFRKLTPLQKQEYVVVLQKHLDVPIRVDTAHYPQSYELQRSTRDFLPL